LYLQQAAKIKIALTRLPSAENDLAVWTRAGALCIELKVSPDLFVQAQFSRFGNEQPPLPEELCGEKARARMAAHQKQSPAQDDNVPEIRLDAKQWISTEFHYQKIFLLKTCGTTDLDDPKVLYQLRAWHTGIPPWLRCYLLPDDEEVMTQFAPLARDFLLSHAEHRALLGEHRPYAVVKILSFEPTGGHAMGADTSPPVFDCPTTHSDARPTQQSPPQLPEQARTMILPPPDPPPVS
jgi:hypothetical protein